MLSFCVSCNNTEKLNCNNLLEKYKAFEQTKNPDTLVFVHQIDDLIISYKNCERAYQLGFRPYLNLGDTAKAKRYLLKALNINDLSIYTLYGLSGFYSIESKNDSALKYINIALSIKLDSNGVYYDQSDFWGPSFDIEYHELIFLRGIIYFETSNYKKANRDFFEAVNNGHEKKEAYEYLANSYLFFGKKDSANYYDKLSKVLP